MVGPVCTPLLLLMRRPRKDGPDCAAGRARAAISTSGRTAPSIGDDADGDACVCCCCCWSAPEPLLALPFDCDWRSCRNTGVWAVLAAGEERSALPAPTAAEAMSSGVAASPLLPLMAGDAMAEEG